MLGKLKSRIQLRESDGLYSKQATQRRAWCWDVGARLTR
jgi:hypothetical protein